MQCTFNHTRLKWLGAASAALMLAAWAPGAQAQYYDGKTIEMIIGAGPGGGMTRTAQRFNQFFEKHIAGDVEIVTKNMPGGSRAQNFVFDKGKKDGTTLYWGTMNFAGILAGLPGIRYDPAKFEFIGAVTSSYVTIVRTDIGDGLKKPADILDAPEFTVAGRALGTGLDMYSLMPLDLLGVKYRYVSGYRSQPNMKAAMLSNEAQAITTGNPGFWAFYVDDNIKKGDALALFYHSPLDLDTGEPLDYGNLYGENVKAFPNFYREATGKAPSGDIWEAYKWYSTYQIVPFWVGLPPGTNPEAIKALQTAFDATAKDEGLKAAFEKSDKGVPKLISRDTANRIAREYKDISPGALNYLAKAMRLEEIKKALEKK